MRMSRKAFEKIAKDLMDVQLLQIQGNKEGIKSKVAEMKAFYIANFEQTTENHKKVDALAIASRGPDAEDAMKKIIAA